MRRLSGVALLLALAGCNGDGGVARVPVEGSPMRGPADAWVTMVEFADFQCPYCGRAAPTVRQVAQTWPDDVRVVFKHLPLSFHAHALSAALAAQCAFEQGRFWEMYDALFADQSKLADADLAQTAQALGLDTGAWTACLSSDEARQKVQADVDLSDQIGVTGTPAFYVNGERIAGAQPFETFRTVIEAKLAAARASGIPAAEYYDKAVLGR